MMDTPQDRVEDQNWTSARLGVSPRTLERWRAVRRGPPYIRVSAHAIRYSRQALTDWLASRTVTEHE
jgi:hypothetical protein